MEKQKKYNSEVNVMLKSKYKILHVAPAFYPAISVGGPIFSVIHFSKALKQNSCEIEIVATTLGLDSEKRKKIVFGKKHNSVLGYPIIYFPYYGYKHFTFSPGSFFWLLKNVKNYDVIILNGVWNFPFFASAVACWFHNVPYFVMPHGNLYKETVELKSSWIKKLLLNVFVKSMLKKAKRVLFTTYDELNKVSDFVKIKMNAYVIPNIVDSEKFTNLPKYGLFRKRFNIPEDALIIIHYGRISKKKGINFIVESLPKIKEKFPNVLLAVVGGDEEGYKKEIEYLAGVNKVTDNITFTGILNPDEGLEALVDSDIFVLPSLSENFGMAVVEAMLCGLPTIISDNVGIAKDVIKAKAGIVIPLETNNKPLINAIETLLNDKSLRLNIGKAGRQFAIDQYDIPAVSVYIKELLSFLDKK